MCSADAFKKPLEARNQLSEEAGLKAIGLPDPEHQIGTEVAGSIGKKRKKSSSSSSAPKPLSNRSTSSGLTIRG